MAKRFVFRRNVSLTDAEDAEIGAIAALVGSSKSAFYRSAVRHFERHRPDYAPTPALEPRQQRRFFADKATACAIAHLAAAYGLPEETIIREAVLWALARARTRSKEICQ